MFRFFRKKSTAAETAEVPDSTLLAANDEGAGKEGLLSRLKTGLQKTASNLGGQLDDLFNKRALDADTIKNLQDILIASDLGVECSGKICEALKDQKFDKGVDIISVRRHMAQLIASQLQPSAKTITVDPNKKPFVILVIGVNGSGKTTTIGKMAHQLQAEGKRIMLVAGDTFRAAAGEQLQVWAGRTDNVHFFYKPNVNDPAALAYEAYQKAENEGYDVLIVDTAGRLHTKQNLMDELAKIPRVLQKLNPELPHAALLVLDATTGQNAIVQADHFHKTVPLTGLVITKLDGTAKGGVVVAIAEKTKLPIVAIGVGEGIDDLQQFDPQNFADNLLGL